MDSTIGKEVRLSSFYYGYFSWGYYYFSAGNLSYKKIGSISNECYKA